MMKKLLFGSAFFFAVMLANSASGQDVMDAIAEETCSCTKAAGTTANSEEFQMQLGLCILTACSPYEKELKKQYNFSLSDFSSDEKKAEEFGMQVGMRMAFKCPELFVDNSDAVMEIIDEEPSEALSEITGVITSVESDQFTSILVKDNAGRTHKLLWLTYFDTSDSFVYSSHIGEQAVVTYYEMEIFNPAIKEYMTYKVISSIDL